MIVLLVVKFLGTLAGLAAPWWAAHLLVVIHALQSGVNPKAGKTAANLAKLEAGHVKGIFHLVRFLAMLAMGLILAAIWWPTSW